MWRHASPTCTRIKVLWMKALQKASAQACTSCDKGGTKIDIKDFKKKWEEMI